MLEMDVVDNNDLKMQMVTTLQSTSTGKRMYADLCERQIALRELVMFSDFQIGVQIYKDGVQNLQKEFSFIQFIPVLHLSPLNSRQKYF